MKPTVLMLSSIVAAALKITQAEADTIITSHAQDSAPGRWTIGQQKRIFDFSRERASQAMELLETWHLRDDRAAMLDAYNRDLIAALDEFSTSTSTGPSARSLLVAETLNNARNLVVRKNPEVVEQTDANLDEVRLALMTELNRTHKLIIIPYEFIGNQSEWGEHGAHYSSPTSCIN